MDLLNEEEALLVTRGFDSLTPDLQARAKEKLVFYNDYHDSKGTDPFPSVTAKKREEREAWYELVDNPLKLAEENGLFANEPGRESAREALRLAEVNDRFLAQRYGKPVDHVRVNSGFYSRQFLAEKGPVPEAVEPSLLYQHVKAEADDERKKDKIANDSWAAGQQAALKLGKNFTQSFAEFQASGGERNDKAFAAAYSRLNKQLSGYRVLIGEVATDAKRMMTSGEGADWSALASRLLTVPKEDRPMVLDALNSMEGDKDEKGAGGRLLHAFARGLEDYIERTAGGAQSAIIGGGLEMVQQSAETRAAMGLGNAQEQAFGAEAGASAEALADLREMSQDIRSIANGTLSPLKDVRVLGANLTGVAENLPMTFAAFVPFVGPASMVANMRDATDEELRREFPEMDRATRGRIATLSAPIQAATEVVSNRLLFGRLPNLKRAFSSPAFSASSIAKQLAGRVALGTATETLEELAQGITPRAIMEVEKALGADVPEVAWGEYFKQFGDNAGELLAVIVPMALLGAGVGQVSDYQNGRALVSNETLLKAAGYDNAPEIVAASVEGRWTDVEGMMRAKWAEVAPKGESVGEVAAAASEVVIKQRTEEVKAATAEVVKIRELNEQAAAAVEQAERMRMIPRIRRDAQGWTVQDVETGSIVRVGSREEAVSMAYESLNDLERKSAEAMAQGAEEFLNLDPKQAGVMELRRQGATPQTLAEEGVVTPEQAQAGVETYAQMHGLTPEEAKAEALWVLGNNKAEMIDGVRTAVSRVMGGGNIITVMHEGIHGRWNEGLRSGRYTQAMGVQWVRMAEMATGVQFLPTADDAKVTPAQLDEAIAELGSADLVGRRKDGKQHFTAGLISRGVSAFALSGRKDAKAAGQFAAWLKSWKSFWGVVLSNAKKLKKARAEGKLGEDFDSFLDDLLGAEPQQRFEAQAAQEAVTMAGEVDNAPFSLSPAGMASDQGAAQNAEPSTGGLTESEAVKRGFSEGPFYHGTLNESPFNLFDPSKTKRPARLESDFVVFLTDNKNAALEYTNEDNPVILTVRAKIKNPLVKKSDVLQALEDQDAFNPFDTWDEQIQEMVNEGRAVIDGDNLYVSGGYNNDLIDWANENGFDAIRTVDDAFDENGQRIISWGVLSLENLAIINPESSRAEGGASFSLAPRSLVSVADTVLASRMKKPEFREAFYNVARQKMAGIRDQMDAIAGRTVDKTQEQWNREMKAREGFEYDRLLRENFGADTTKKQEALPVVDRQAARSEARTFAERWLEGEKKKQPTPKERQMAALRTLDAILSAFDDKIRGRVGGFYQLAKANTDAAREKEIVKRLEFLDQVVEKEAKKFYRGKIEDTFEKAKPKKGKAGEKPKGKLGAQTQALVDLARTFSELDELGVSAERAAITDRMSKETDPAKVADLFEREQLLDLFGDLDERTSAELEAAAAWLADTYDTGRNRWRAVIEAREAEMKAQREAAVAQIGKASVSGRQAKRKKDAGKEGIGKFGAQSFDQVLSAILGRGSQMAKAIIQQARNATTQKTDAMNIKRKQYAAMMASVFGTENRIEWMRKLHPLTEIGGVKVTIMEGAGMEKREIAAEAIERIINGTATAKAFGLDALTLDKLADAWADNEALPANRRKKNLTFEVPHKGTADTVELSEMQALHVTMLARQPGYTENMAGHGWTAEVLEEIEKQLSTEAKAIRDWLAGEYRNGYDSLNEVYARMYGVNLPRLTNYAPGTFEAMDMMNQDMDPYGQGLLAEGGFKANMTKSRGKHTAEPRLEDALSVYWGHVGAVEHFKAFAEFSRDLRGVMNNAKVRVAIEGKGGLEMLEAAQRWLTAFEQNGLQQKASRFFLARWLSKFARNNSYVALAYNFGTLMKQSTAALGSLLKMSPTDATKQFARLVSGQLDLKAAYNSATVQRRMEAGYSPEVRQAMAGMMAQAPTAASPFLWWGMDTIGRVDALFTTASYAMAWDFHYQEAKASMSDEQARAVADQQADLIVSQTAQPSEMMDRSVFELESSPEKSLLFMFASEARQKFALALEAYSPSSGLTKGERATRLMLLHIIFPMAIQTVSNIWRDARDDDDDELFDDDNWRARDYAIATAMGPLMGFPVVGDALETVFYPYRGGQALPVGDVAGGALKAAKGISEGDFDGAWKGTVKALRGSAILFGGDRAAAVAVGARLASDVKGLFENVEGTD